MTGKGDSERWHKRDNYPHIFRKDECECEECEDARTKRRIIREPHVKSKHAKKIKEAVRKVSERKDG